jgi:hypothetical protein
MRHLFCLLHVQLWKPMYTSPSDKEMQFQLLQSMVEVNSLIYRRSLFATRIVIIIIIYFSHTYIAYEFVISNHNL